jgi:hypothetical protein
MVAGLSVSRFADSIGNPLEDSCDPLEEACPDLAFSGGALKGSYKDVLETATLNGSNRPS